MKILAYFVIGFSNFCLFSNEQYVIGSIFAELGNNLFQVATTYALAWEHNAIPLFPEMVRRSDNPFNPHNVPLNHEHIFYQCNVSKPTRPITNTWTEPSHAYHPISFKPNMRLSGYFQSEKYFVKYRERLLKLFYPLAEDIEYIKTKYKEIIDHPCSIGIQIRHQYEDPSGKMYIQYGKDYIRKAISLFPSDAFFVFSSNNVKFCRENIPEELTNYVVLENEPDYIDFFVLMFCKHNIITNSTFGWWSAWLNQHPHKIIIAPAVWYHPSCPLPTHDLIPGDWIRVEAKYGPLECFDSYQ